MFDRFRSTMFTHRSSIAIVRSVKSCNNSANSTSGLFGIAAILISLWIGSLQVAAQDDGGDWPGFLGLHGNGKSSQTGIITDWSKGNLSVRWSRPLGEGYGIGSLAEGKFYQADRVKDQSRLVCLDAETGEEIWEHAYATNYVDMYGFDGGPRSTPLIDEGRVYHLGVEGWLHCLDANDGSVLWKADTIKDFGVIQNFFGVGVSPIVHNNKLIVMVGGSPASSQNVQQGALNLVEADNSAFVAFDKETGKVIYRTGNDLASYSTPVICRFAERDRCVALCREKLVMFDPDNGEIKDEFAWRAKKLESVNASSPVIFDENVFITESYGPGACLLKIVEDQFQVVWKDEPGKQSIQSHWATSIEVDGHLYGCHGQNRPDAELRCIDAKTGQLKWSEPDLQRTTLTWVDGYFVCLSETGRLILIRPNPLRFEAVTEYEPTESVKLLHPCWSAPIVADKKMFVRSKDRLICFTISNDD